MEDKSQELLNGARVFAQNLIKTQSLGEIYAGLNLERILQKKKENKTPETCIKCGSPLEWKGTIQYQTTCLQCGNIVIATGRIPEKEIYCWVCYDTGICEYEAQIDDQLTLIMAACVCKKGDNWVSQPRDKWQGFPRVTQARCAPPPDILAQRNIDKSKWK